MAEVETIGQRPLMPTELLKAAIEGDEQVLTEMLGLEEDASHTSVTIESAAANEIDKNLKSATFMGNTVLHILCYNNHGALASKVCKKDGSLLRARNKMLETPLHRAAHGITNKDAIFTLIEFARGEGELILKELLRDRNNHGETALHVLARFLYSHFFGWDHAAILEKMMEGDLEWANQVDSDGISPMDLAIARGYDDVTKLMMGKLSDFSSGIYCSQANQPTISHDKTIEIAQHKIEMPTSYVGSGSSRIHLAASTGNICAATLLLEKDASLFYLRDSIGLFPIHIAARMGHVRMVIFFMQRYLDFDELVDRCGRNFLHTAAEGNVLGVFTVLFREPRNLLSPFTTKILNKMINTIDNEGNTPLHIASEKGYKSLMNMIHNMDVAWHSCIVRNRKGLTAFDISVMEVKTRMKNSPEIYDCIEQYRLEVGDDFLTPMWFHKVMSVADGSANDSSMTDQLQMIGLGAVLITTVTFAAAFTLPGGYNSNGSPVLEKEYLFKAFILAITSAFLQSFFCVLMLMVGGLSSIYLPGKDIFLSIAMYLFSGGARSMVLSFGLGLYLVLSRVNKGLSILILVLTVASVMLDVTPKVLNMINKVINIIGFFKKDLEDIGRRHNLILTFLGALRFVLPFVFIFILAFIS